MREAVRGESIEKAVGDIMRLSSGLKYLKYVLVCAVEANRFFTIKKVYLHITQYGSTVYIGAMVNSY